MNIFEAAECNDLERVKSLIESKANASTIVNDAEETIAHIAARNGHLDLLKYIVDNEPSILTKKDANSYTVLQVAIEEGALDAVKYLVEKYQVNICELHKPEKDHTGTAVHRAVRFGHLNLLRYFIEDRKVDINLPCGPDFQPSLFLALKYQHREIIDYLIDEKKADVKVLDRLKENILFVAVRKNDLEFMKFLLDKKKVRFDINWKNWQEKTVLHVAALLNRIDILKYLIGTKRAKIDAPDIGGKTPLHIAASKNHSEMCEYLIYQGARIDQRDVGGGSPLHGVTSLEMCQYLIKRGANINHLNNRGDTLLHVAAFNSRMDILKFLIEGKYFDVNILNKNKIIPLHYAASVNNYEICAYLVEHGADTRAEDEYGDAAAQMAFEDHLVEYLKNASKTRNRRDADSFPTSIPDELMHVKDYFPPGNRLRKSATVCFEPRRYSLIFLVNFFMSVLTNCSSQPQFELQHV